MKYLILVIAFQTCGPLVWQHEANAHELTTPSALDRKIEENERRWLESAELKKFEWQRQYIMNANCGGETPRPQPASYDFGSHSPAEYSECAVWRAQCLEGFRAWVSGPRRDVLATYVMDDLGCMEY